MTSLKRYTAQCKKLCLAAVILLCFALAGYTQEGLVPNQNPRFEESRAKYMKLADSLNLTQSTTLQQTYKAYDYLEMKREFREERRRNRQAIRLERARWNSGWNQGYYWNDPFYYGNNWGWNNGFNRPGWNHWNNGWYRPIYPRVRWNQGSLLNSPLTWSTVGSPFFWLWLAR